MQEYTLQTTGDIDGDGWLWGTNLEDLENSLRGVQASTINVPISSYGGDLFTGLAIYQYLKARPETIHTSILGFAMSMGSVIAMAGDKVSIPASGYLMIHNVQMRANGDENVMAEMADYGRGFSMTLAAIYSSVSQSRGNTKLSIEQVKAMMDKETFLTAAQALEYGFVTDITDKIPVWVGKFEGKLPESTPSDLINIYKNSKNMENFNLIQLAKSLTGKLFSNEDEAKAGLMGLANDAFVARLDSVENIVSGQLDDATKAVTEFKANYVPKSDFDALKTELDGLKTAKTDLEAKMNEIAGKLAGKDAEQGSKARGGAAPNFTNLADKRKEFSNVVRFQTKEEAEADAKA